jgi:hypothetical protein
LRVSSLPVCGVFSAFFKYLIVISIPVDHENKFKATKQFVGTKRPLQDQSLTPS